MRDITKALLLATLLPIIVLGAQACRGGRDVPAERRLNIVAFLPVSGALEKFATPCMTGARLAARRPGAPIPTEVILQDNAPGDFNSEVSLRRLLATRGIQAVLVGMTSDQAKREGKAATRLSLPIIAPTATLDSLTEDVGPNLFRTCFSDAVQGRALAKYTVQGLNCRRPVIVVDSASSYSKGLAESATTELKRLGVQPVGTSSYAENERSFRVLVGNIARLGVGCVVATGNYPEVGPLVREMRAQNLRIPVIGGDGLSNPAIGELIGPPIGDVFLTNHFSEAEDAPAVRGFAAEYRTATGQPADASSALCYDAVTALQTAAASIAPGQEITAARILAALPGTSVQGVTGLLRFGPDRTARKSIVVERVLDRGFGFVTRITPE